MNPHLLNSMPETSSASATPGADTGPRILHREWKVFKPYLPKSTSLPAMKLLPRDRPRYSCCRCGFVNFYNIPLCVWCGTDSESAVRAFERTVPRTRTTSAPPRVFWKPNELGRRASGFSQTKNDTGNRCTTLLPGTRGGSYPQRRNDRHSMMVLPVNTPIPHEHGRPQRHKRSHSEPNALRIGHRTRPYYSVIRKNISSHTNSGARQSIVPRPLSQPVLPPTSFEPCPTSINDDEEFGTTFAFVTPAACIYEARSPKSTLSARIGRGLSSPVSAVRAMSRAAEMRGELAALVRQSGSTQDKSDAGAVGARLKRFRRSLGLSRRSRQEMESIC
ncbi:hypothetical protein DFH06DRAFT_88666 [Mycena polygramma]|nr:hypothetical protein DFH06DRAFT_88666 [Mycena polygramma]